MNIQLIKPGPLPLNCTTFKAFLGNPEFLGEEELTSILEAATIWGENYTGRDFRSNVWEIVLDHFPYHNGIILERCNVKSIDSFTFEVEGVPTEFTSDNFQLVERRNFSELVLLPNKSWPQGDESTGKLSTIRITFTTGFFSRQEEVNQAIMRHAALLFNNRGDCRNEDSLTADSSSLQFYNQIKKPDLRPRFASII